MAMRRMVSAAAGALLGMALWAATAAGHHGWRWTEEDHVQLTGVVKSVELGNPHGIVILDVGGEEWRVELGPPARNTRAGIEEGTLVEGMTIVVIGHRSADPAELRLKAERIHVGGVEHNIYPDRD
jgi:hypothetical protein